MGMAASQARLLMLTSRLHDVELKAQQLQNAKLQLSTQQDAVYEDYQKALDATTLTGNFINSITGARSDAPITFSNLFSLGAATSQDVVSNGNNYILVDSRGRVVLEDEIIEGYNNYLADDSYMDNAYMFAWYMVEGQRYGHWMNGGNDNQSELAKAINSVFTEHFSEFEQQYNDAIAALDTAYNGHWWANDDPDDPNHPSLSTVFSWMQYDLVNGGYYSDGQKDIFYDLINHFWSKYGTAVFNQVNDNPNGTNMDGDDYNKQEFDYYVRIYNAIQQHGGCISIEDYNGPDGSAATNNEWLTAMLQSGQMSLEIINIDNTGNATLTGASVASESALSYTATTQIDKVAMAKAEAEYEHEMKVIDKKEQKIDLELKKIETERTAITKEYDSIKKVSDDNIDRTFGIFS